MASEPAIADTRSSLYQPVFPEHWERRSLYSLADWVNGLAFRNIQFSPTGKPVIKIAEIKAGISDQTTFTDQTFDEAVRVRHGDLLFSWSGQPETSIDAFKWRGPEGWLNQHIFRVTPGPRVDRQFFYYLLRYLKPNFVGIARNKQTTGLGHVTKRDLQNIQAAYPDMAEQRAIAHILGTLDDKIDLNRRMSVTLEAMARALFKSWFVDFEPVRARSEGRDPGLPKHVANLFPSRLEASELGEIPEAWSVRPIGEQVRVLGGGTPSTKESAYWRDGTHAFCTPKDMSSLTGPALLSTERHLTDEGVAKVSSGQLPPGVVLLSSRAPIGYLAVADIPVTINQGIIAMLCDGGLPSLYVLHWARSSLDVIKANASGSTFPEISKRNFKPIQVVVPKPSVLDAFVAIAEPLHERIVMTLRESELLRSVRCVLLPRLIAGEIRIPTSKHAAQIPSAQRTSR